MARTAALSTLIPAPQPKTRLADTSVPSPVASTGPLLDEATIERLRGMDRDVPGLLERLVAAFVESAPALMERLRAAVGRDDMIQVRQAAHTLKSSLANVGALAISRRFAAIEVAARTLDPLAVAAALATADAEFGRVMNAVATLSIHPEKRHEQPAAVE
jgi:HPt (histidine-containing phosphotransfer) domain-containing protein